MRMKHLRVDFAVFNLLIIFRHLFHGISQGIISYSEQLRVLPDTLYISGSCFLSVPESMLDEICRIFGLFIKT